ncbi:abortive infection family protein [Sphaerisporangium sp. NBC_01403]|uniref:abortive infection family protein n=1 Tax=Sphaerisporangium sp. NBC_01403 TaxID=2903599 RepID=UPI00325190AE
MSRGPDLISRTTRNAFRRLATDLFKPAITEYWENEHFAPVPDFTSDETSVRRRTFDSYASGVDWTDVSAVERALRVLESMLRRTKRESGDSEPDFTDIREGLARDGYQVDEQLRILALHPHGLRLHLDELSESSGIRSELERIRRVVADYPDDAIGAAKQLIEATAKVVLQERAQPVNERSDLPELIKQAQIALLLHPSQQQNRSGDPDNAESVKRVLGSLSSLAIGVAEMRNRYGTGHGRFSAPSGLGPRHARLAVNAAATWCEILLDTLTDPKAPWRMEQTHA